MKKKFREITVEGVDYAWAANRDGHRYNGEIKIWRDKKVVHVETVSTEGVSITPVLISEIIKEKGL